MAPVSSGITKRDGEVDAPSFPRRSHSVEAHQRYLLRKPVAQPLVLLLARKRRSPPAFQGFAAVGFCDFGLAGWEEGRSVRSCPPSTSLGKITVFSLLKQFHQQTSFSKICDPNEEGAHSPSRSSGCCHSAATQPEAPSLSLTVRLRGFLPSFPNVFSSFIIFSFLRKAQTQ